MPRCPECGASFRIQCAVLVDPVGTNYIDNALNIAEYFSCERSWKFYKQPYFKFRECMEQWFASLFPPPPDEDKPARRRWMSKRASYFEFTEARIAYGLNFCARDGSAYGELKRRLAAKVEEGGYDMNDEFEPFSVEHEFHRMQDEMQERGLTKEERNDMFLGFKKGQSAVSRILRLNVEGSDDYLPISDCNVSEYFPELKDAETDEKAVVSE